MNQEFSTPPPGVGIKVVKSLDHQLVIAVPPGGKKARGLGCFGFAWMAIVLPVTGGFLYGAFEEGNEDTGALLGVLAFSGLFWAVGIGTIIAWIRMRFTEIFLSVERDLFAIQKTLFGRKKLKKISLDENSHADLVESYSENDVPVYAIQMEGVGETEKFATGLSYEEKRWLVKSINQFLGVNGSSGTGSSAASGFQKFCGDCGSELMIGDGKRVCPDCARVYLDALDNDPDETSDNDFSAETHHPGSAAPIVERPSALDPYELPKDSRIRIDFDDGETLAFSYRIQTSLPVKIIGGSFLTFFCCCWYGGVLSFLFGIWTNDGPIGERLGFTAFISMFLFAGLMPLGMLLSLFFGRASIRMSRENVIGAIGVWFLKKKKSISTESITDVGLATTMLSNRQFQRHRTRNSSRTQSPVSNQKGAIIESSEFNMPLTMSSDASFNEQVAGLVRFQLQRSEVRLPND